eukprot:c15271_g1_i1 orf=202-393(+)
MFYSKYVCCNMILQYTLGEEFPMLLSRSIPQEDRNGSQVLCNPVLFRDREREIDYNAMVQFQV